MTSNLSVAIGVLALALQTPTPTPVASPKPAATAPVTQGTGAARPGALVLTVVNEKGEPLRDAFVTARGAVDRSGPTLADGTITLQNMPVGTYRARISREGFITLEKEVAIRSAARTNAEAVLSAAPPTPTPSPTPSPTPTPEVMLTAAAGAPGTAKTVNIAEMADQILNSKDTTPLVSRQLGCSGVIEASLLVARDNVASHRHADVDEMVYLVAGDATLTIADQNQTITAGWFGLVPRGQTHSLTRRGRNPMVFLLVHSGKPCSK